MSVAAAAGRLAILQSCSAFLSAVPSHLLLCQRQRLEKRGDTFPSNQSKMVNTSFFFHGIFRIFFYCNAGSSIISSDKRQRLAYIANGA